ncbi:MAG: aspartyl/asparaginyl beta-hydroxylase domain-containing protein [Gammaproteobacteria bacterium]|nr:aspartyl/asparaginyl beta-hydroxylase domain-containing protein [Gammaproteobacteria bacterium]
MDIGVAQRCLGEVDMQALKDRILAQEPEAWAEQAIRQQMYEVHKDTESIVMLFCEESWPEGEIYRESGWERLADVAMPVIDNIINTYYESGGLLLRAMAAKLKAQGRIPPHRDKLSSFHIGHRVHVPITTSAAVRYTIAGKPYQFEVGNAYEINNQELHSVMNMGKDDRISFIFDYVPADKLPGTVVR